MWGTKTLRMLAVNGHNFRNIVTNWCTCIVNYKPQYCSVFLGGRGGGRGALEGPDQIN